KGGVAKRFLKKRFAAPFFFEWTGKNRQVNAAKRTHRRLMGITKQRKSLPLRKNLHVLVRLF
ncbi:MAG: hypothetical protein AAGU03_09560, partial [Anaerolineaceae bacterium]